MKYINLSHNNKGGRQHFTHMQTKKKKENPKYILPWFYFESSKFSVNFDFDSADFRFCCTLCAHNLKENSVRVKGPKLTKHKLNEMSRFTVFVPFRLNFLAFTKKTDKYWLCSRSHSSTGIQTFVHANMNEANKLFP